MSIAAVFTVCTCVECISGELENEVKLKGPAYYYRVSQGYDENHAVLLLTVQMKEKSCGAASTVQMAAQEHSLRSITQSRTGSMQLKYVD